MHFGVLADRPLRTALYLEAVQHAVTLTGGNPGDTDDATLLSFRDEDSFIEWGETLYDEDFDTIPEHLQIATPYLAVAITVRSWLDGRPDYATIPTTRGESSAVISLSQDWATGDDLEHLITRHAIDRYVG